VNANLIMPVLLFWLKEKEKGFFIVCLGALVPVAVSRLVVECLLGVTICICVLSSGHV